MHIWHPWKLSNFQNRLPPCPSASKILPPFWPWTSNFKRTSPSPSDKQSIKGKRNPRLTNYYMLSVPFLQVSLGIQYQLINLVWLSFEFLHLGEASLSAFLWLYNLVCAVIQKYHEMPFIYNYSHFCYTFCNQLFFIRRTWKRKQTMEQQPHRAWERTKSKQK